MENKKAVKVLSNAFRGLRNVQTILTLNWLQAYITGAVSALADIGCISNREGAKILARSNAIYSERVGELAKEKAGSVTRERKPVTKI